VGEEAENNPYETPGSTLAGAETYSGQGQGLSVRLVNELKGTKPWVRLCSVLGFISAGLYVVTGIAVIALMGAIVPPEAKAGAIGGGVAILVIYCILAGLVIYPAMKLYRYGGYIGRLMETNAMSDLEEAMAEQRRFWLYMGILFLIGLILAAIYLVFMIILFATAGVGAFEALKEQ
jgi:hypothetical protein